MSTFRYFLELLGIFGPFWHFWALFWYSTCLGLFSTPVCSCYFNLNRGRNKLFLHSLKMIPLRWARTISTWVVLRRSLPDFLSAACGDFHYYGLAALQKTGYWLVVHQFGLFLSNLATQVFPAPVLMSRSNKFHNIFANLPNLTTPCSFFAAAMRRLQYHGLAVRQTSSSWTQVYIPDTSLALALMSRPKMFRNV